MCICEVRVGVCVCIGVYVSVRCGCLMVEGVCGACVRVSECIYTSYQLCIGYINSCIMHNI